MERRAGGAAPPPTESSWLTRLAAVAPFPPLLTAAELVDVSRSLRLTPRETETLDALARGLSDKEIATELRISLETARKHRGSVLRKCGCKSRLWLVLQLVHELILARR